MKQIEIAKKILEQGNCDGIRCYENNCMLAGRCEDERLTNKDMLIKVKQWLKEQESEMIDLTKNQIVEPMVEAWFWDVDNKPRLLKLRIIDHNCYYPYKALTDDNYTGFKNCSLTDPNKPKVKKWETVMDVPPELWGKALVKYQADPVHQSVMLEPTVVTNDSGIIDNRMHYLPLGQPLDGEWLEFESEVTE